MQWEGLGDGVLSLDEEGSVATFTGEAPGGGDERGIPAVRIAVESENLDRFEGLAIRAEGGGVPFELRLHTGGDGETGAYRVRFDAPDGEFRQIRIPFAGVGAASGPPLDPDRITELGFAVASEHTGPFRLRLEWVRAYGYRSR